MRCEGEDWIQVVQNMPQQLAPLTTSAKLQAQ